MWRRRRFCRASVRHASIAPAPTRSTRSGAPDVVPLLEKVPAIRATTVLEELQRLHPGRFPDGVLRSLQRRIAHWRATEGPERELIFRQEHPPGRQALSDFTHTDTFTVTIAGEPFEHMLYHFWLAFSGWEHVRPIQGGESFTALTEGLQEALWQLGGVPRGPDRPGRRVGVARSDARRLPCGGSHSPLVIRRAVNSFIWQGGIGGPSTIGLRDPKTL